MKKILTVVFILTVLVGAMYAQILLPPRNLSADVDGDEVTLIWDAPSNEFVFSHSTTDPGNAYNLGQPAYVAHRYNAIWIEDMGLAGTTLTHIHFAPYVRPGSIAPVYTLHIWSGSNTASSMGTLARTQQAPAVTTAMNYTYQIVELEEPFTIPASGFAIGYHATFPTNSFPLVVDEGPIVAQFGDRVSYNGISWGGVQNNESNWAIKGQVALSSSRSITINPNGTISNLEVETPDTYLNLTAYRASDDHTFTVPTFTAPTRSGITYNVYRGDGTSTFATSTKLTPTPIDVETYDDAGLAVGFYIYYVTAVRGAGESTPISVPVTVGEPIIDVVDAFIEGFENPTFPPAGWRSINRGTGLAQQYPWERMTATPKVGIAYAGSRSWIGPDPGTDLNSDNWLITPMLNLAPPIRSDEKWYLAFYLAANSADYVDQLTVYYTRDNPETTTVGGSGNYTRVWASELETTGWQEVFIDLTDVNGTDITGAPLYLAFRHFSADNDHIKLDNVIVKKLNDNLWDFETPTGLVADNSGADDRFVNLSWTAPPARDNLVGYNIYRNGYLVHSIVGNTTQWQNTVSFNGTYTYEVTAVYEFPTGESVKSQPIDVEVEDGFELVFPPSKLAISIDGDDATLTWDVPVPEYIDLMHAYGVMANVMGLSSGITEAGIRFTGQMLQDRNAAGKYLDAVYVCIIPYGPNDKFTVGVYTGGSGPAAPVAGSNQTVTIGNLVHSIPVVDPVAGWNKVILPEPLYLTGTEELWLTILSVGDGVIAMDDQPAVNYFGNLLRNPYWRVMHDEWWGSYISGNTNYMIVGSVINLDLPAPTRLLSLSDNITINNDDASRVSTHNLVPKSLTSQIADRTSTQRNSRGLQAYNVYTSTFGEFITPVAEKITEMTYTIENIPSGANFFGVSAVYSNDVESDPAELSLWHGERTITSFPYNEYFEDSAVIGLGWTLLGGDDYGNNWFKVRGDGFGFEDSQGAVISYAYNINDANEPRTPNNYLVSPKISIPAGSNMNLYWSVRATSKQFGLHDRYGVYISTTEPTIAGLGGSTNHSVLGQAVFDESTTIETDWRRRSIDLSGYAGNDIYVAFRHFDSRHKHALMLDYIRFAEFDTVSDEEITISPVTTALMNNYPNPFNPSTTISFNMATEGMVSLEVFNIKGQKVNTLVNDVRSAGVHTIVWNGKDLNGNDVSSGVYFYRMKSDNFTETKKMILMK